MPIQNIGFYFIEQILEEQEKVDEMEEETPGKLKELLTKLKLINGKYN